MDIDWLGPVPSTNYHVGRDGRRVAFIVDHWTAASFDSAYARFMDPSSVVSAHYLIRTDGRTVRLVSEDDTAYHAGDYVANEESIGIEHEASPSLAPSDSLYAASAALHADIATRYGMTLAAGATVVPHWAIVPTQCPGSLDLGRIVEQAMEEDDMFTEEDRRKLNRVYDHLEAYEAMTWSSRVQQSLARAIRSIWPNADLSGPDVVTGEPLDSKVASRR